MDTRSIKLPGCQRSSKRLQKLLFRPPESVTPLLQLGAVRNNTPRLTQKQPATLIPSRSTNLHAIEQRQFEAYL